MAGFLTAGFLTGAFFAGFFADFLAGLLVGLPVGGLVIGLSAARCHFGGPSFAGFGFGFAVVGIGLAEPVGFIKSGLCVIRLGFGIGFNPNLSCTRRPCFRANFTKLSRFLPPNVLINSLLITGFLPVSHGFIFLANPGAFFSCLAPPQTALPPLAVSHALSAFFPTSKPTSPAPARE